MRIIEDVKYDYSDLLIIPKRSSLTSRKDVDLTREYKFLHSPYTFIGTGIIAANMSHTGTFEMATAMGEYNLCTAIHKHYSEEELIDFFLKDHKGMIFYTIGMVERDYEKFKSVIYNLPDGSIKYLNIDVANGYTQAYVEFVKKVRDEFPNLVIMAGTVTTPEMTEQLILSGADIVRIGIGSGSVCTTRKVAGVGYPIASAVMECADAAHGLRGHIVSDGGCTMPGDIAKAFGAGADFVMLGGMLAGHDECDGERVYNPDSIKSTNTPTHMKFFGMSSKQAMEKFSGGVAEYRASEGKEVLVPYRGKVENTIKQILGGVRSCCTYVGAKTLKELPKRTTFVKVNRTHNTVFGDEK